MKKALRFATFAVLLSFVMILPSCDLWNALFNGGKTPPSSGSTTTVGKAGGTISASAGATITIPAGALTDNVQFQVTTLPDPVSLSSSFGISPFVGGIDVKPDGVVFSKPVTVKIPIGEKMLPGLKKAIFTYDQTTKKWTELPFEATVDDTGMFVTAEVTHFCPVVISPFPVDLFKLFQQNFDGTNAQTALSVAAMQFTWATGLYAGTKVQTSQGYWLVKGLLFTVDYSFVVNSQVTKSDSAIVSFGNPSAAPENATTYDTKNYDYTASIGGVDTQVEYEVEVYIACEPCDTGNDFSVRIFSPAAGGPVEGTVAILADVTFGQSGSAVSRIDFYVDGNIISTATQQPWSASWDTSGVADGAHTLKAVAVNANGDTATSKEVPVQKGSADALPPFPGGAGALYFTDVLPTSAVLHFSKGWDALANPTPDNQLQYKVVWSQSGNVDTVEHANDFGSVAQDWTYAPFFFAQGDTLASFPLTGLSPNTDYYVNILAKDPSGNTACYVMGKTTTLQRREVVSVSPTDGATGVTPDTKLVLTFSHAMDEISAQAAFTLAPTTDGTFSWDDTKTVMTFTPKTVWTINTQYQVAVSTAAKDEMGVPLTSAFASNFKTDNVMRFNVNYSEEAPAYVKDSLIQISGTWNATFTCGGDFDIISFPFPISVVFQAVILDSRFEFEDYTVNPNCTVTSGGRHGDNDVILFLDQDAYHFTIRNKDNPQETYTYVYDNGNRSDSIGYDQPGFLSIGIGQSWTYQWTIPGGGYALTLVRYY